MAQQLDLFDTGPARAPSGARRVARGRVQRPRDASDPARGAPSDPIALFLDQLAAAGRARHSLASIRLDLLQLKRFLQPAPAARPTLRQLRAFVRWLATERGNGTSS